MARQSYRSIGALEMLATLIALLLFGERDSWGQSLFCRDRQSRECFHHLSVDDDFVPAQCGVDGGRGLPTAKVSASRASLSERIG